MGILLSRFYEKPSTRDTLEKIEQELQNIEERRWDKIKREQFIVQILSFIPITILIANVCILIYPSESTWRDKLILSVPIVILNLVLWVCRKIVQWYSRWSLDNEEARLRKLQKEKKRILEMVCETESYRVATELLEKYDPKQLRRREKATDKQPPTSPMNTTLTKFTASPIRSPKQTLSQPPQHTIHSPIAFHNQSLNIPNQPQLIMPAAPPPTPTSKPVNNTIVNKAQLNTTSTNLLNTSMTATKIAASSVQGRPVRPILSKDRSFVERVVDWVVADGPENRFALICRYCYGHNGMSLAEEFETINFRCCYCYNLNTASNKSRQIHDQLQQDREKSDAPILEAGKNSDIHKPDDEKVVESTDNEQAKDTAISDTSSDAKKKGEVKGSRRKAEKIGDKSRIIDEDVNEKSISDNNESEAQSANQTDAKS